MRRKLCRDFSRAKLWRYAAPNICPSFYFYSTTNKVMGNKSKGERLEIAAITAGACALAAALWSAYSFFVQGTSSTPAQLLTFVFVAFTFLLQVFARSVDESGRHEKE
jgi:hypothetical protein